MAGAIWRKMNRLQETEALDEPNSPWRRISGLEKRSA